MLTAIPEVSHPEFMRLGEFHGLVTMRSTRVSINWVRCCGSEVTLELQNLLLKSVPESRGNDGRHDEAEGDDSEIARMP